MFRKVLLGLLVVVVATATALFVVAQPRKGGVKYAFLVACSGYQRTELKPLPYTINDIEGFREALLSTGFGAENIKVLHDKRTENRGRYLPEKDKILSELALLLKGLKEADTVVVALSGHGVHFKGDKTGYFCPVNAKLGNKKTLIPMEGEDGLFEILKVCKAGRKLLIVNACRNDPASDLAQAANKINLDDEDKEQVPEGIAALYSCGKGEKSYYDDERKRGIFFDHVIRAWNGEYQPEGELRLENFFTDVVTKTKADVDRNLAEPQVPVVRREYSGEWIIDRVRRVPERASAPFSEAKAKELQRAWARYLKREVVEEVALGGGVKMEFVLIPPGTFTMGSPKDEKERDDDEEQHAVEITRPFYLGKYEVTRGQFRQFVKDADYTTEAEEDGKGGWGWDADRGEFKQDKGFIWKNAGYDQTDSHPVVNVSWNDADKFCLWLKRKVGKSVHLPSEAEWEYGCRAGTTKRFYSGDDAETLAAVGNVADGTAKKKFSDWVTIKAEDGYVFAAPVGKFEANAFGLHDMHGNVWEWCRDYYGPYKSLELKDPLRTEKVDENARVLRGGSWGFGARNCRAAYRRRGAPSSRSDGSGFRVAFRLD